MAAGNTAFFVFQATAQDLTEGGSNPNYFLNDAERTSRVCYMRGFSEHLRIQTNSSTPWFHRRICFTIRGGNAFNTSLAADTPTQPYRPFVDTTNGMERLWFDVNRNNMPASSAAMQNLLFKGTFNVDWNDQILAPIDTSRVSLKYDKTFTVRTGNNSGALIERKLWHPMNKNIVYDDDESGQAMGSSYYSVDSKLGMGDYFIVDIIQAGLGAVTTDLLNVFSNSTLYWHEK